MAIFSLFDKEKNGTISNEEMRNIMTGLKKNVRDSVESISDLL